MDADFFLLNNYDPFFEELVKDEKDETLSQLLAINTQQLVGQRPAPQSTSDGRFAAPLSATDIEAKAKETTPKTTQNANIWAIGIWKEWAIYRNTQVGTVLETGFPVPEDIGNFDSLSNMDFWLQRFIHEIRRKDGKPYPPETLKNISAGLQRYLRNEKNVHVNLFKSDDPTFAGFQKAIDSRMRQLTNEGIGVEKKSADPVAPEEERKFWETGVFSIDNALGLSNAVFYYNGKVFGFRGGSEHIGVQSDQYTLGYDDVRQRRYVKFTPRIRKNAQGGLKQSKAVSAMMTPIKHYDRPENECSVYRIFETYLNLIPRIGPFYRKPLDGMRYSAVTISQRDLKGMMKRFFDEAGISLENRTISNHSGRVTLCSTLYNKQFSDKSVMSRSKHISNAVHAYQKEDFGLTDDICSALEPPLVSNTSVDKENCVSVKHCSEPAKRKTLVDITNNVKNEETNTNSNDVKPQVTPFGVDGLLEITVPNNIDVVVIHKNGKKIRLEI